MKFVPGVVSAVCAATLSACASNPLPPPNAVRASFDPAAQAVRIVISNAQPPSTAELVNADGARFTVPVTLLSAPHVKYSAPPSVGLGLGGFGGGFLGGLGFDVPLGGPRPTGVDDQYIASVRFGAPADYAQRWNAYHVEVHVGAQSITVPAPPPVRG